MSKTPDGVIELCSAVRHGHLNDLAAIVETGVDVNSQDKNGETGLHVAVWHDYPIMVTEIINLGGDVDIQNLNGQTPLHIAAIYGYTDVVRNLLEANPDTDICTKFSEMTALHLACLNGHTETVRLLLKHGADPDTLDVINKPPEFYASNSDINDVFTEEHQRRLLKRYVTELDFDLDKSMQEMSIRKPVKRVKNKSMKYSRAHKRKMKLSVFDRLTRRKSQFPK